MSFPASSEHPAAVTAAPVTPRTFRKSRRLTPLTPVLAESWLILVVAVRAIVARLFPFTGLGDGRSNRLSRCGRLRRVSRGFESFLLTVAVHMTADAPAHVEAGELVDAIHFLDLPVTRLAGNAGVDV